MKREHPPSEADARTSPMTAAAAAPAQIAAHDIYTLVLTLDLAGYASDIDWAESVAAPENAEYFASEVIYVICNSGMRFTVARKLYDRVCAALYEGLSAHTVFGHKGKASAIDHIWQQRETLFQGYIAAADKLSYLRQLPWIGNITVYHAAKNLGVDCCKPDVHLTRLARACNTTPEALCATLSEQTGYRVATIDLILWRASAIGILDSHTAAIRG